MKHNSFVFPGLILATVAIVGCTQQQAVTQTTSSTNQSTATVSSNPANSSGKETKQTSKSCALELLWSAWAFLTSRQVPLKLHRQLDNQNLVATSSEQIAPLVNQNVSRLLPLGYELHFPRS